MNEYCENFEVELDALIVDISDLHGLTLGDITHCVCRESGVKFAPYLPVYRFGVRIGRIGYSATCRDYYWEVRGKARGYTDQVDTALRLIRENIA